MNTALVLAAAATPAVGSGLFTIISAAVVALGGLSGVTALILVASQRRKNDSESRKNTSDGAHALTSAAVGLIKPLEERLAVVDDDNRKLRDKVNSQERHNTGQEHALTRQRSEIRTLRGILGRIRDAVATPADADPAAAVQTVRGLVATVPDSAHLDGR